MFKLTIEQQQIIYCNQTHIYVSARAGTGKTTTLIYFAKQRKNETIIYIVYNNSNKEYAIQKFPPNVVIHTAHSLAYQYIGIKYKDKLKNNLKVEDIFKSISYFKDKSLEDKEYYKLVLTILNLINSYCISDKNSIEEINDNKFLTDMASEYWNKMIDIQNKEVYISQDGYLKLFQLSKPELNFDWIMVDEAQDSNEAMLDIIYTQNSSKIFVGDPEQKIYGFRGALNIFEYTKYLSKSEDKAFLNLTESFRFGEEIASVANELLITYRNGKNLIKGNSERDSIVGELDYSMPYTIITRTNAKLIDLAIQHSINGKKISVIGGIDSTIKSILDGYWLYKGRHDLIKNEYFKTFKNYFHLKTLAETLHIAEYALLIYLIEKYGDSLLGWIELLKRNHTSSKLADITLTTAHKSKGLEFVSVVLENDFVQLFDKNGKLNELVDKEEINLLYVAATRATHELELNEELKKLMER